MARAQDGRPTTTSTHDQTDRQPKRGPEAGNLEEKLQHVAAGRAISFLLASLAATFAHPGIAYVQVAEIPPIQVCLAWKATRPSPLILGFLGCVTDARRQQLQQPKV